MPEAAVHEHRPLSRLVGEIGRAGQTAYVLAVGGAEGSQRGGDGLFGTGVFLADAAH